MKTLQYIACTDYCLLLIPTNNIKYLLTLLLHNFRLFDTSEERYVDLKNEVSNTIMTQVGLTMFQYNRDLDSYLAVCYTFHLSPQVFGEIDQTFIFQASTLNFLCKHKFDFNKVRCFLVSLKL